MWIAAVLLGFVVPVIYVIYRETRSKKSAGGAAAPPKKKEPLSISALVKVCVVMLVMLVPVYFLSWVPYTFYPSGVSALKVAFKQNGKRIADCNDANLFQREGERYRKMLKTRKEVKMDMSKLAGCPRERYPVVVRVTVDGKEVLNKSYAPTGLKKDMSSYVYEQFIIKPGVHDFAATLSISGPAKKPDYTLNGRMDVKPGRVALIYFNDETYKLSLE